MPNVPGILAALSVAVRPGVVVPDVVVGDIRALDWRALYDAGVRAVVLDKDNLLTLPHQLSVVPAARSSLDEAYTTFGRRNVLVVSNSAGSWPDDGAGTQASALSARLQGGAVLYHRTKKPGWACAWQVASHFLATTKAVSRDQGKVLVLGDRATTDLVLAHRIDTLLRWRTRQPYAERDSPLPGALAALAANLWVLEGRGSTLMRNLELAVVRSLNRLEIAPGQGWLSSNVIRRAAARIWAKALQDPHTPSRSSPELSIVPLEGVTPGLVPTQAPYWQQIGVRSSHASTARIETTPEAAPSKQVQVVRTDSPWRALARALVTPASVVASNTSHVAKSTLSPVGVLLAGLTARWPRLSRAFRLVRTTGSLLVSSQVVQRAVTATRTSNAVRRAGFNRGLDQAGLGAANRRLSTGSARRSNLGDRKMSTSARARDGSQPPTRPPPGPEPNGTPRRAPAERAGAGKAFAARARRAQHPAPQGPAESEFDRKFHEGLTWDYVKVLRQKEHMTLRASWALYNASKRARVRRDALGWASPAGLKYIAAWGGLVSVLVLALMLTGAGLLRLSVWYNDMTARKYREAQAAHEEELYAELGFDKNAPIDKDEVQRRLAVLKAEEEVRRREQTEREAQKEQALRERLLRMPGDQRARLLYVMDQEYVWHSAGRAPGGVTDGSGRVQAAGEGGGACAQDVPAAGGSREVQPEAGPAGHQGVEMHQRGPGGRVSSWGVWGVGARRTCVPDRCAPMGGGPGRRGDVAGGGGPVGSGRHRRAGQGAARHRPARLRPASSGVPARCK